MKPMRVIVGEKAPDLDELIEKANNMDEMLQKVAELRDDSQIRNITGVEEAPMSHYWTNQDKLEGGIENVQNRGASSETISFDSNANPHQTGSTLSAHENTAGGEIAKAKMCPCGSGKPRMSCCPNMKKSIGVSKAGMPMPPPKGPLGGPPGGLPGGPPEGPPGGGGDDAAALAALLGGAGGEEGGSDLPEDPSEIGEMLVELGKKVKALGGGGGDAEMPPPDMPMGDDEGGAGPPTLPQV